MYIYRYIYIYIHVPKFEKEKKSCLMRNAGKNHMDYNID